MLKDEGEASESSSCVLGGELEVTQELLYEFGVLASLSHFIYFSNS